MDFKDVLKRLRSEANISQEALAKDLHISRSAIAKYEAGLGIPSKEISKALANYFHIDESELLIDKYKKKKRFILPLIISLSSLLILGTIGITLVVVLQKDNSPIIDVDSDFSIRGEKNKLSITSEGYYPANTYLDFELSFYGKKASDAKISYTGNVVTFDEQSFAKIYYQNYNDESIYLISFINNGRYTLEYEVGGFKKQIKFLIDDTSSSWNSYRYTYKDIYKWDGFDKDNVGRIEYDITNASKGYGLSKSYYSKNKSVFYDYLSLLDNTFIKTNRRMIEPGKEETKIQYTIYDKTFILDFYREYLINGEDYYLLNNKIVYPNDSFELFYRFNPVGNEITAVNIVDQSKYKIENFYKIGFVLSEGEVGEEKYQIEGYRETIKIYSSKTFSYQNNHYKIITSENFSALFNN